MWLCANNRVAEAEQIIRNAAELNNIKMPGRILAHSDISESPADDKADDVKNKCGKLLENFYSLRNWRKSEKTEDGSARYTLLDIFRNRHLTVNMFCMLLLGSVTSLNARTFIVQHWRTIYPCATLTRFRQHKKHINQHLSNSNKLVGALT